MSTGLNCELIEAAPGRWWWVHESHFVRNPWDWREEAEAGGPYPSEEACHAAMRRENGNPGGYTVLPYDPKTPLSPALARLIDPTLTP